MAVVLFTDFGSADIYRGQVMARLADEAPQARVIELMHDVPPFNVRAGAHLLAALVCTLPAAAVVMAVVDPGVGGPRAAIALHADGRWYVGPDNGLLSVVAARATVRKVYPIIWQPLRLSASFHGRDLFAPVAAALERGEGQALLGAATDMAARLGGADLTEVIYVDHYGNAMTGLRARHLPVTAQVRAGGTIVGHARVYSDAPPGGVFWYENSLGLVEIAAHRGSAAALLGLKPGMAVEMLTAPG